MLTLILLRQSQYFLRIVPWLSDSSEMKKIGNQDVIRLSGLVICCWSVSSAERLIFQNISSVRTWPAQQSAHERTHVECRKASLKHRTSRSITQESSLLISRKCGGENFRRTGMLRERKGPKLVDETLLPRGEEYSKFLSSWEAESVTFCEIYNWTFYGGGEVWLVWFLTRSAVPSSFIYNANEIYEKSCMIVIYWI